MPATTTDRSDEGHAEAAGSVESHIGSPAPSLVVLHPGAPQQHSQIRRSGRAHHERPWTSAPALTCASPFVAGRWHPSRVAVTVAVKISALSERSGPVEPQAYEPRIAAPGA